MKLHELRCDNSSFKPLRFNDSGLSLIVGDGASSSRKDGNSNGVGKTLTLALIHHCLGANADSRLKAAVPTWFFSLRFSINGHPHEISRSGDGSKIFLDDEPMKVGQLRDWLNKENIFSSEGGSLSFRSLIKRFARHDRGDCDDPLKLNKETPYDALLRSLFLLGLNTDLAISKRKHKQDLDKIAQSLKALQEDENLKTVFRAGTQPKVRAEWLEKEIPRLQSDLDNFQISPNYRLLEESATKLTKKVRNIDKKISIAEFQLDGIIKSLKVSPDISSKDLQDLYIGLENIFKPETLEHFDTVEKFHNSLSLNRKKRLNSDKAKIETDRLALIAEKEELSKKRDKILRDLQGKKALDEYTAIANELSSLKAESEKLKDFMEFSSKLLGKAQKIREDRIEEDRISAEYVASNPEAELDKIFIDIAEKLYPRTASGIVLENNVGDNQVRYDLTVQIEGDDSDGINAAKVLCFDWLLLNHGANHTVDYLWHDNRLFADIDPKARAAWFNHVQRHTESSGKQYIASINTENFEAMSEHFEEEQTTKLNKSVILRLCGDKPENKLLGLQFGKPSE